jgi:arylsulfatase A-like enzyme
MGRHGAFGGPSAARWLRAGIVLVILVAGAWTPAAAQHPERRSGRGASKPQDLPNIVIFLIDTLRADRLGVYGYERRPTSPRIDELARESVVFEEAIAPSPWTLPTVVSLFTSTYPCEHGTLDDRQMLSKALKPLPERLHRMRYTTLGLYGNPYAGPSFALNRGYDVLDKSWNNEGQKVGKLLDDYPGKPFFLYIHNMEPHDPHLNAPQQIDGFDDISGAVRQEITEHYTAYRPLTHVDFDQNQPLGTTDNTAEQDRHLAALTALREEYHELNDGSVWQADHHLGSVIDELKRRGLWDSTLFIVLSDHGEELNEHGGWLHDQSVYEELIHVPLIVRFPRGEYGGRRVDRLVSLIDIMPTIFDFLDEPSFARGARGRSLMPLIRGYDPAKQDDFQIISMRINTKKYYRPWKQSRGDINLVVRHGEWKGIWNAEPKTLELYNLAADPGEQNDASAANPQMALVMELFARQYYEQCTKHAAPLLPRATDLDEETRRDLRALGYLD